MQLTLTKRRIILSDHGAEKQRLHMTLFKIVLLAHSLNRLNAWMFGEEIWWLLSSMLMFK